MLTEAERPERNDGWQRLMYIHQRPVIKFQYLEKKTESGGCGPSLHKKDNDGSAVAASRNSPSTTSGGVRTKLDPDCAILIHQIPLTQ